MRTKGFIICFILGIIYISCDETVSRVGLGIQPDEDKISVFDTTVVIEAKTIEVDSVYAKTINGLLGEIYDPSYGVIKSGYICQYYPSIGFIDFNEIENEKIDSVRLRISYQTYYGDSVAPMEATVYPVNQVLGNHYYTNVNPEDFCDMNNPLSKYAYTARNLNVSIGTLLEEQSFHISIPLPVEIGQKYLEKVKNNELTTTEAFLKFFPGTYITTTFGTGSMLPVDATSIQIFYTRIYTTQTVNGEDSVARESRFALFSVTKEIIQLNSFKNKNPDFILEDNADKTYIKSPAGVFTELTIPIKEIVKGIGSKKFSSVKLSLKAYQKDEWEHSFPLPGIPYNPGNGATTGYSSKLLLIEPDSVANFFEDRRAADNRTSFTTSFNSSSYSYEFNNIANIVQNAIDKAPDKDLKLWVIPVLTHWQLFNNGYSTTYQDYMTSHYLYPSGVTLKKGGDNLKVRVIATDNKTDK